MWYAIARYAIYLHSLGDVTDSLCHITFLGYSSPQWSELLFQSLSALNQNRICHYQFGINCKVIVI